MLGNVFVVDVGSSCVKSGYCGDDSPAFVYPTVNSKWQKNVQYVECIEESQSRIQEGSVSYTNTSHPYQRGAVVDWDQMSKYWQRLYDEIGIKSIDIDSILIVESPKAVSKDRLKWAEILFEKFGCPSICFLNSASASVFASGRTSGIAVDCGAGCTSTVPVYEGLALKHASITSDYGGQDITQRLHKLLSDKRIYTSFNDTRIVKESKVSVKSSNQENFNDNLSSLTLPDGTEVEVDDNVFNNCTNYLFKNNELALNYGLSNQLFESLKLCDESLKKDLFPNVILAGGTTMLPGFGNRLRDEVNNVISNDPLYRDSNYNEIFVTPNSNFRESGYTEQRKYAAWIGGSILGSMDTYNDLKINKSDYDQSHAILDAKCY